MNTGKIIFYTVFALAALIMLLSYMKSEKPVKTAAAGMVSGGAALLAVHFWGGYAGLSLPINFFTASISLILGVPAVIIMALMN